MEVILKKPYKLPPLKIQGKHIAGTRFNEKYQPTSLKNKMGSGKREEKRQSLPTNIESQILQLTTKDLTEKERILILSLQERIKIQRKVLEDRKHMVNAIRLNFERLERLLDQKEVENKLLKLKVHELQKSKPADNLVLKGRGKVDTSPDKPSETHYRKKSVGMGSRENSKLRQSPSSKQYIQRPVSQKSDYSPKKFIIHDVQRTSLAKTNQELQEQLEAVQEELQKERKLRKEVEEKCEKKQIELIKLKKELDSLLRNSQKASSHFNLDTSLSQSLNQNEQSDGEEPELMMKKLNVKISLKKKIKKLHSQIEELQREEEDSPVSSTKRDKKRNKSKFKYSLDVSAGDSKHFGQIVALKSNIKYLEEQLEKIEQGDHINLQEARVNIREDFNSTDTEDIEDYRILFENEFSTIKKVCEQKNVCTLQRRELESTVSELQQRIEDKEQEWEKLQDKFVTLERKIINESKTQDEVELLRKIIEEHESELNMMNKMRAMAEKQKTQLQTRIQLLFQEIVKSESKITNLSNNLAETEETKALIAQKYNERESEVKKLKVDLQQLNDCVEELAHTCPIYPY